MKCKCKMRTENKKVRAIMHFLSHTNYDTSTHMQRKGKVGDSIAALMEKLSHGWRSLTLTRAAVYVCTRPRTKEEEFHLRKVHVWIWIQFAVFALFIIDNISRHSFEGGAHLPRFPKLVWVFFFFKSKCGVFKSRFMTFDEIMKSHRGQKILIAFFSLAFTATLDRNWFVFAQLSSP